MTRLKSQPQVIPTEFRQRVDESLGQLLTNSIDKALLIDDGYARLLELVKGQVLGEGKRLRPFVMYTAYEGTAGADPDDTRILTASISQELIHNFLLIHDDVIDRDTVRHGRPNVLGVYDAELREQGMPAPQAWHQASSFAILAGNACLALGLDSILRSRFPAERKLGAVTLIQRLLFEEMGGQFSDMNVASPMAGPPSLEQLLRICRYKTATYSFEIPLLAGAELAGAQGVSVRELARFGQALGVAFQLTDDLLGVYGDESAIGKPVLSDLHEGKHTVLIHFALEQSTPAQKQRLLRLWGDHEANLDVLEEVRSLLDATGARARTLQLADSQMETGLKSLDSSGLSVEARTKLKELARFCVRRDH